MNDDHKEIIIGLIRSISASFPVFSSVAQAWNEIESHYYKKRIEEFFSQFESELSKVKSRLNEIENQYNQDEVIELIQKSVSLAKETSNPDKREFFPKLLTSSIINPEQIDHESKLNFINSLDFLSIMDIQILNLFKPNISTRITKIIEHFGINSNDHNKLSTLITSLTKLESRGLIGESDNPGTESYAGFGTPDHWTNRWQDKHYEIMPNGISFLAYLSLV